MIWLAAIPAFWVLVILHACWAMRRIRRLPAAPVPYWPAPNPCTWCKPVQEGDCICAGKCGHVRCVGDHTSMATLTAADMRLLAKWIREGQELTPPPRARPVRVHRLLSMMRRTR